jgi:hypothetical protein
VRVDVALATSDVFDDPPPNSTASRGRLRMRARNNVVVATLLAALRQRGLCRRRRSRSASSLAPAHRINVEIVEDARAAERRHRRDDARQDPPAGARQRGDRSRARREHRRR